MKEALKLSLEALEILKQTFFRKACLLPEGKEDDDRYLRGYEEDEEEWALPALKAIATAKAALAKQDGQSNFCAQCEAFARELKAVKQALAAQPAQEPPKSSDEFTTSLRKLCGIFASEHHTRYLAQSKFIRDFAAPTPQLGQELVFTTRLRRVCDHFYNDHPGQYLAQSEFIRDFAPPPAAKEKNNG